MANLNDVFHSLADGTRRAVIAQLADGPASISTLAERHPMALPSFLKHIRVLEKSEIIVSRKSGRVRLCELRPEALSVARGWLEVERRKWSKRFDQLDALVESQAESDATDEKR